MCLAFQLIAGKLVRKNHPTQVTGFVVDLIGKCVEGMQMNWASYIINELREILSRSSRFGIQIPLQLADHFDHIFCLENA
jgi:phage-related holin